MYIARFPLKLKSRFSRYEIYATHCLLTLSLSNACNKINNLFVENGSLTPSNILEITVEDTSSLLPAKSGNKYLAAFSAFMEFRKRKKIESFSENVVLDYFKELSEKYKASSLWSIFSMLRCTLNIHQNIDIISYEKLQAFLKRQSDGYSAKKSKVFTRENVEKFLTEAPDYEFLATKVKSI